MGRQQTAIEKLKQAAGSLAADQLQQERQKLLDRHGMGQEARIRKLKAEWDAKETKFIKLKKGEFDALKTSPKKVPAGTVLLMETAEEVLLAIDVDTWAIQQAARMDASKMGADYPNPRIDHKLSGEVIVLKPGKVNKPKKAGL